MTSPYKQILDQVSGIVICTDLNHQIIYLNSPGIKLMGFKDYDHAYGCLLEHIPCRVSEYSHVFGEQNNQVNRTQTPLKFLDIHPFMDNENRIFLTTKSPLAFENGEQAVLTQGTQISRSLLLDVCKKLADSDKKFRKKNNVNHRSYQFIHNLPTCSLSSRELECMFYLIRGKSALDIANILQLSKRTIESYIENLKVKMQCSSKAALIEKAINNNFIDFIPESLLASEQINFSVIIDG